MNKQQAPVDYIEIQSSTLAMNNNKRKHEDIESTDKDARKRLGGVLDLEARNNEDKEEEPEVPNMKAPRNGSKKLYVRGHRAEGVSF